MYAAAIAFAAALFSSLYVTPAVRDFALRRSLVDAGGVRKVHARAVPRLGGVAFVAVWYVVVIAALAFDGDLRLSVLAAAPRSVVFLAGGVVVAALGFVDDVRGLRARHKLAVQFLVAAALCWAGFTVHEVELPTGAVLHLGVAGVPLTMLWIAGVMNAMNLIDGLDGLAAGIAELALLATFVMAAALGKPLMGMYTAALAGAVCGFLAYNFNPATIFMGDSGSLFLGYFLAIATVVAGRHPGADAPQLLVPLAILAIPVTDTLLAIARRAVRGRALFSPDRNHLHHRLLARGFSQRKAVLALYLGCAGCCGAALAIWFGGVQVDLLVCGALAIAAAWFLYKLRLLDDLDLRLLGTDRTRNRRLHARVGAIAARLEHASTVVDVLDCVHELAPVVSAARIKSRIGPLSAEVGALSGSHAVVSMRFPLACGPQRMGRVEVAWADGRTEVDEDQALAIEGLCEDMARAVQRLEPAVPGVAARRAAGA